MKNSPDFHPVFGERSNKTELSGPEDEAVFLGVESEISRGRGGVDVPDDREVGKDFSGGGLELQTIREQLSRAALRKPEGFTPAAREGNTFVSRQETSGKKPSGGFRRWVHVALAGLGLLGADKLQAADSKGVPSKPDAVVAGVPVFKAPMQANANTNVYKYEGEIWQPKTPEEKEKMSKARAALEAQAAAAKTVNTPQPASYGQHQQRNENPVPHAGARPELNQSQSVNAGHYPNTVDGRFINRSGSPRPNDVVVIQGQGGIYYPEPSYPQHHDNYGMRGRYSAMPMPSTVYYGVPPGGQIPTKELKLFGKKFQGTNRGLVLGEDDADTRGGRHRGGHESSSHPQKPKSR